MTYRPGERRTLVDPTECVPRGRREILPHELTAITKSTADVGASTVLSTETEISNKGPVTVTSYTAQVGNAIPQRCRDGRVASDR